MGQNFLAVSRSFHGIAELQGRSQEMITAYHSVAFGINFAIDYAIILLRRALPRSYISKVIKPEERKFLVGSDDCNETDPYNRKRNTENRIQ